MSEVKKQYDYNASLPKSQKEDIASLMKLTDSNSIEKEIKNSTKLSRLVKTHFKSWNVDNLKDYSKHGISMISLQDKLVKLGFDLGKSGNGKGVDGSFGKKTFVAIIMIQKQLGLNPTGIVNVPLLQLLYPKTFKTRNKNEGRTIDGTKQYVEKQILDYNKGLEKKKKPILEKTKEETKEVKKDIESKKKIVYEGIGDNDITHKEYLEILKKESLANKKEDPYIDIILEGAKLSNDEEYDAAKIALAKEDEELDDVEPIKEGEDEVSFTKKYPKINNSSTLVDTILEIEKRLKPAIIKERDFTKDLVKNIISTEEKEVIIDSAPFRVKGKLRTKNKVFRCSGMSDDTAAREFGINPIQYETQGPNKYTFEKIVINPKKFDKNFFVYQKKKFNANIPDRIYKSVKSSIAKIDYFNTHSLYKDGKGGRIEEEYFDDFNSLENNLKNGEVVIVLMDSAYGTPEGHKVIGEMLNGKLYIGDASYKPKGRDQRESVPYNKYSSKGYIKTVLVYDSKDNKKYLAALQKVKQDKIAQLKKKNNKGDS